VREVGDVRALRGERGLVTTMSHMTVRVRVRMGSVGSQRGERRGATISQWEEGRGRGRWLGGTGDTASVGIGGKTTAFAASIGVGVNADIAHGSQTNGRFLILHVGRSIRRIRPHTKSSSVVESSDVHTKRAQVIRMERAREVRPIVKVIISSTSSESISTTTSLMRFVPSAGAGSTSQLKVTELRRLRIRKVKLVRGEIERGLGRVVRIRLGSNRYWDGFLRLLLLLLLLLSLTMSWMTIGGSRTVR
jgi:hypothetical protein